VSTMTTLRKKSRKQARRANKKVSPVAADTREATARYAEAAKEWAGPKAEAAKDWAAPRAEAARDWASPKVEDAVTKVKSDVIPKVAGAVTVALVASEPVREEAKTRGTAAVAALKGEVAPPPKKHRLRKLFVLAGVLGAAYVGWRAWAAKQNATRTPEPWAAPAPSGDVYPVDEHPLTDDPAAASPDEALADAAEEGAVAEDTSQLTAVTETVPPSRARKVKDQSDTGS
jgi:hypothetical protein